MNLVRASIHTMATPDGVNVRYARLGYRMGNGNFLGRSVLLHRLTQEERAIAESGSLVTLGRGRK
ncbi:hypothetical protein [Kerstersia gyiorum]|uniref:hypothetical protein n=1 Tax=Kerstersia gyiorum TaxID=206506 RepID=UPI0020A01B49|nr:hypothetical protein [Kerstersia gyiorum]MCP1679439.1 hypothetical protein [Kerstersia gyiorum]MCP1823942.1 hypothetical protein [Kerstersia gyiorum]MCP1827383.1 hypothetical protein [Kerstersia gyiorum]MCW2448968.1 hypothetical protein [Kerstersia gyiorum]